MNIASMSQKEIVKMYQDELSDAKRRIAELEGERNVAWAFIMRIADPFQLPPQDGDYYNFIRNRLEDG